MKEESAPKRQRVEGKLDKFVARGGKQEQFLKDVVKAFAATNTPLSKLEKGSPMRQLFEKYMTIDGDPITGNLVDPINLRGTWLPKVYDEGLSFLLAVFSAFFLAGIKKLQDIIRSESYFVCLGVDETDDPRPTNEFIVTVEVLLIPKVQAADQSLNCKLFHLKLDFPKAVNNEDLSVAIDQVLLSCLSVCTAVPLRCCEAFMCSPLMCTTLSMIVGLTCFQLRSDCAPFLVIGIWLTCPAGHIC